MVVKPVQHSKPTTGNEGFHGLDRRWHLAKDAHEVAVTELEYSLIRAAESFRRWQSECLAAVTGMDMSGGDNEILHIIRMKDRPKGVKEIARLMNRDDLPNIQYSIRKLQKAGLIRKTSAKSRRKGVTYAATEKGAEVSEQFAQLRSSLLMGFTRNVPNMEHELENASRTLDLMSGIYEQAARTAATHRQKVDD
ncbi:MAG: hypothetical protein D6763_08785 [Alphaproteobacteria bacterium]|nr:MAG: hypothetical protein D6763_08785 [Alphaproteobacteria bacterium]